ncbi:hypothetical protein DV736_g114, partial [Chaetothyriales sp. CBS 134916]
MVSTGLEKRLQEVLNQRQQSSKLRSLKPSPAQSVDFSSNDFLSLSSNAEFRADYLRALSTREFPLGSTGSRLLDGNSTFAEKLEQDIAAFHGSEAGLLTNSGFDANVSIFTYLPQPGDIIVFDELIHASVHDGMRQSRARATLAFRHNDIGHLRKVLIRFSNKSIPSNIFVAVESVYSMEGDLAPLMEMAELIEELFPGGNAHMIVDEAHATGIYGPLGAGRVSELGLENRVSIRLHTFGKALASNGAIILCSPTIRLYLINYARPLIYTTFMSYPSLMAIKVAYNWLKEGKVDCLSKRLTHLIGHLHQRLQLLGEEIESLEDESLLALPAECPQSPIFALLSSHPRSLAAHCQESGFVVRAVVSPTVPQGTERVRVCLHAGNTEEQIDRFVATASEWLVNQKGVRMKMTVKRLRDIAAAPPTSVAKSPSTLAKLPPCLPPGAMVYELHIWGPAFGLPSIDAPCLATVAYLKQCLPRNSWVLIPTSDPSLNPLGQLPALKDGDLWIGGYRDIVIYLRTSSSGEYDLSKDLTNNQQADCAAYASFIEWRAQPILDLSLYVSSENYSQCTKPALANILTWPNSWFVPHKLREMAKKRSEHLGLKGLDIDSGQDEKGDQGLAAQIPKSLQKPRQTVSSVLGREIGRNKFRLDAVASDFLEPLEEMLGGKKWLVSDSVTSADCLALAYLSLLRGPPDLPQSWLWDTMKSKHPYLEGWVLEKRAECFGPPVSVNLIPENKSSGGTEELPWQPPSPREWHDVVNSAVSNIASTTIGPGSFLEKGELQSPQRLQFSQLNKQQQKQQAVIQIHSQRLFYNDNNPKDQVSVGSETGHHDGLQRQLSVHAPGQDHLGHSQEHTDIEQVTSPLSFEDYKAQMTAIFILEFGIIFHSIFIGLTLAVAGDEFNTLFIVLIFHQTFEGLGLGSRLAVTPWPKDRKWTPYVLGLAYGLSTPVAIGVGLGVRKSYPPGSQTTLIVNGVFDSISAGILIYTGLVELMAHEFMFSNAMRMAKIQTVLSAFVLMCLGAALMALLGKWA